MARRLSGYARKADDDHATPSWVVEVIGEYLRREGVKSVWEPAAGSGQLARSLSTQGFEVWSTTDDFFSYQRGYAVDAIVTNPPYGPSRRSDQAADFIRHALGFDNIRLVVMLLRVDFDSAKSRVSLFRDCPAFAGKIVLIDRIKWFAGPSSPSDNHAVGVWDRRHKGLPWIRYAGRYAEDRP